MITAMSCVEWLDTHSGAVMAVLTGVLLIITAIYVIFTGWTLKHLRRQTDLMVKQDLEKRQAAIGSVWAELAGNAEACTYDFSMTALPLETYPQWIWACSQLPVGPTAREVVSGTYAIMRVYNAQCSTLDPKSPSPEPLRNAGKIFKAVGKGLGVAMKAMKADPVLKPLLQKPATEQP